jgi:hypothetical protein
MSHPCIKSEFIYCESRSTLEGCAFILHLEPPFTIGNVYTFRDDTAYLTKLGSLSLFFAPVPGYRVIIHICGSLTEGRYITFNPGSVDALHDLAWNMVSFFIKERIAKHSYYKKFKM